MVGSTKAIDDRDHDDRNCSRVDDGVGNGNVNVNESLSSGVSCSICLELVDDNGIRSRAKLLCGHQFHLDCIGSAFNMKGAMQCPNCRKVEKGQWLYANSSSHSLPRLNLDEWLPDLDLYDLHYSEMPFGVHWCPFGELARIGSSFGEEESPFSTNLDIRGNHSAYAEHTPALSVAHSYVTYGIPPASSRSNDNVEDSNYNRQWNGPSGQNDIVSRQGFPTINVQYHSWGHHCPPFPILSSHINGAYPAPVPLTSISGEPDTRARPTSSQHPFLLDPWSHPPVGSSFLSVAPCRPGSSAQTNEGQFPQVINQRQQPGNLLRLPPHVIHGIRSPDDLRGLPMLVPPPPQCNHGIVFVPPSNQSHIHAWETRDRVSNLHHSSFISNASWGSVHHNTSGSNSGNRPSSF